MMNGSSKRVAAAISAGVLAFAMAPLAAFGLSLDESITVGGLEPGDSAGYYQIVEQNDADADTYYQAAKFTADAKYYTRAGEGTTESPYTYTQVDGVTADNFADADRYCKLGAKDWKLTAAVDSDQDGIIDGSDYSIEDFVIKVGEKADATNTKKITADMANAIASALAANSAASTDMGNASPAGKVTATGEDADHPFPAGLYMVEAVPGADNTSYLYKPIFVSVDYYSPVEGDEGYDINTEHITLVGSDAEQGATDYDGDDGVFKKSKLTVDKKSGEYDNEGNPVDTMNDVSVGDVIPFIVTTNIPTYTNNYEDPEFEIADVLSTGLELQYDLEHITDSIVVTVDGYPDLAINKDYVIVNVTESGFTVKFQNDADLDVDADGDGTATNDKDGFLYTVRTAPKVTITYQAKVTSEAAEQVNQMDNTVTLTFSNDPTDKDNHGDLTDKTRHYTFDIDASVFGSSGTPGEPGKTSEIRKVGIDANGDVIEEVTTSNIEGEEPTQTFEWLENAEFELTQTQAFRGSEDGTFAALDTPVVIKFDKTSGVKAAADAAADTVKNPTSDGQGFITMKGLDAGVYTLREIAAPAGYTFDPAKVYTITITPTYEEVDGNAILASYEVKIEFTGDDGQAKETATTYVAGREVVGDNGTPDDAYDDPTKTISFLNDAVEANNDASVTRVDEGDVDDDGLTDAETTLIVNKKLGFLPATGGSGVFFYLFVGAGIMALAVFLGILKRRSSRRVNGARL